MVDRSQVGKSHMQTGRQGYRVLAPGRLTVTREEGLSREEWRFREGHYVVLASLQL